MIEPAQAESPFLPLSGSSYAAEIEVARAEVYRINRAIEKLEMEREVFNAAGKLAKYRITLATRAGERGA